MTAAIVENNKTTKVRVDSFDKITRTRYDHTHQLVSSSVDKEKELLT